MLLQPVNGVYASENRQLLTEILKDEWGFEGFVVSDWGAVHDRVAALQGGLDLEMPGPRPRRVQAVVDGRAQAGELDEAVLDEAVRRILRIVFKAAETPKGGAFDAAGHHALARQIAGEGMVLLKNDGILPLRAVDRIAVIGRAAQEPTSRAAAARTSTQPRWTCPSRSCSKLAGGAEITYCEGYPADDSSQPGADRRGRRRGPGGRRGAALRRPAHLQGIRGLRPGRPRPDRAPGGADPGRDRRAAADAWSSSTTARP